ncbi:MAG: tryptophan synthase subunit alpha [Hadesarchaea archaeon]|nr:tryptophan synthase subunit alpha [Hadesarchaea archaeon]
MKINEKFEELSNKKEGAYIPHIYYGDPSRDFSIKLVQELVESGADLIELGIPFSDPTADGPTFQAACERALENNVTPKDCIEGIKTLRENGVDIPIIVTTYYNIPYVWGIKSFLKDIKEAGAQGIIIPNLPVDEADEVLKASEETDISPIFLATPTTTEDRLKKIMKTTSGFLYIVNVEGVTGAREKIPKSTLKLIQKTKNQTEIPLVAGFGISSKEHAKSIISAGADGIITGSAIGKIYEKKLSNPEETLPDISRFAKELKKGCIEGYNQY